MGRETGIGADRVSSLSTNGCTSRGAATQGDVSASPIPTTDSEQAAADPSAIFKELWEINGPFEEPWMSAFNAGLGQFRDMAQ
jgi:hypothetical protein